MISKEKLLKKIHELINSKNSLIPLFERHVSASLTFSEMPPATLKALDGEYKSWMLLQMKHVEILKEMVVDLLKRSDDVF